MDNYSILSSEIEVEYQKFHELIKKKFPKFKDQTEAGIKSLVSLIKVIPNQSDDVNSTVNFKNELNKSISVLLKPIYSIIESKTTKLYLSSLSLLKKFIIYNLINEEEYNNVINYLKETFINSAENIQLKVFEILQYIINGNIIKLTEVNDIKYNVKKNF